MATYSRLISVDWGVTGLEGTDVLGYRVFSLDYIELIPRTLAGVTEIAAGQYVAVVPNWDTIWSGLIVWEDDTGTPEGTWSESFLATNVASGSGAGPYAYTITVTAAAAEIVGAYVSMSAGSDVFTAQTDADGVASFSLAAGTYTLAIVKQGYQHAPQTVVVTAAGNTAAAMTAIGVTPATDPARTTAYLTCLDKHGNPAAGVEIDLELLSTSSATAGLSHSTARRTQISDDAGYVEFTGCLRGASYRAYRGDAYVDFTTANAATSPIDELLGQEA